jgi:hypothetical protein
MKQKTLTVKLVGGIGNQLFVYYAGVYCAIKSNLDLRLDIKSIDLQHTRRPYSIASFDLVECDNKIIGKTPVHLYKYKAISHVIDWLNLNLGYRKSRIINEQNLNFDKQCLKNVESSSVLHGFFYTFEFYSELKLSGAIKELNILNPSRSLKKMQSEMLHSTAIHIRRGDTVNFKKTSGNLSLDYYLDAIDSIRKSEKISRIFIFSDDIAVAHRLKHLVLNVHSIDSTIVTGIEDPAENLYLFSKARNKIIANSSFSSWGAMISGNKGITILPKPFNQDYTGENSFFPIDWKQVASSWE